MKKVFKKIKALSTKLKLKVLATVLIFGVLSFCVTTYLRTFSEYVSNPNNLHGVNGTNVYVNDADEDWYFYMGRNYTSNNGTLPTQTNKNLYNENTLVETTVTYSGRDTIYTQTGYVSKNEVQDTYIYYHFYPVNNNGTANDNTDDYIMIELIDTPFTDRPNNLAFNGWTTSYTGAFITLDMNYYVRYAKVPITYTNNKPNHIDITFNVSWVPASVGNMGSSWSTAFNNLKNPGMVSVATHTRSYNFNMAGYYKSVSVARNRSCAGYYNASGVLQGQNCTCYTYGGCTYYDLITNENYTESNSYFELVNNHMNGVDHISLGLTPTVNPKEM